MYFDQVSYDLPSSFIGEVGYILTARDLNKTVTTATRFHVQEIPPKFYNLYAIAMTGPNLPFTYRLRCCSTTRHSERSLQTQKLTQADLANSDTVSHFFIEDRAEVLKSSKLAFCFGDRVFRVVFVKDFPQTFCIHPCDKRADIGSRHQIDAVAFGFI